MEEARLSDDGASETPSPLRRPAWKALALRLPAYLGIVASLLVFPEFLPFLSLAWIIVFCSFLLRGKAVWLLAAVPAVMILVRRPDLPPALILHVLLLVAAARGARWISCNRHRVTGTVAALTFSWAWLAFSWSSAVHTSRRPTFDPDRPIICIGDSLTSYAYPHELAKRVRAPVLDHGVGGTTAAQGLAALQKTLDLRPQAVLVEFGGHDYLKGRSRAETREALAEILRACREIDAEPILFEIPRGFVYDGFGGIERGLAREMDLEVIPDGAIRWLVLRSPWFPLRFGEDLSDDGLHPNVAGNAWLADHAAAALARVFGHDVLQ